jgi:hypothetical protein
MAVSAFISNKTNKQEKKDKNTKILLEQEQYANTQVPMIQDSNGSGGTGSLGGHNR